ncbi:DUF6646 family protein [Flavobacterium crassostreae]|uniref:Outer membrane protein beta-barrel domain-containing protein n=1 Tax=Flavobacterium crassostreae TaxID=1763534 RepID=A0A1B9E5N5_9FLAO|nr:DUF6646 family protein [Flavobacterium crassostreae]OCB77270.1 hypothetical protein LPBF_04545 [Flavobacterium crassostreae]
MKKIITLVLLCSAGLIHAQAFEGAGDSKINIGANLQKGGSGIQASADFGIGENFSYGFVGSYLLDVQEISVPTSVLPTEFKTEKPAFKDRFDAKFRINANLSSAINIDDRLDIYPGLSLGLKNFGGHLGSRYFFSDGFGVFTELGFPIAKYGTKNKLFDHLNNQFTFSIGASFNL